jgi:hypothetical protein
MSYQNGGSDGTKYNMKIEYSICINLIEFVSLLNNKNSQIILIAKLKVRKNNMFKNLFNISFFD